MDVRDILTESLRSALGDLGVDPLPTGITIERPANPEHGDWSTNVALTSAKAAGRNPRELGMALAGVLEASPPMHVTAVEVAGPGFVNFRLANSWLHDVLVDVVSAGSDGWATHTVGTGLSVMVEFVSANPTGPLHAGHGRGACYGDSLARLYQRCGHEVTREFYINDRGAQMQLFADSLAAVAGGTDIPEGGYHGHYIREWAAEMPEGADPLEWGYERALADQRRVLESLDIHFDSWFSERSMIDSGAVEEAMSDLRSQDAVYEDDGAIWLRSSDHGDDKDRVLVKSDTEFTYLLPDVAYHRDKFQRADRLVNVWGADHHGYVARMHSAMQALGHDPSELQVAITQMVSLQRGGEEVRLSKRTGEMVELAEVVDEVGTDAARFTYLLLSVDSQQTFDLDLVASQVNENPVFYVQYAHARIDSIVRRAAEAGMERTPLDEVDLSLLGHQRELALLRALHELPDTVLRACRERAPHQVTTWVRELAASFHGFYHDCRVMGDGIDEGLSQARLWLVEGVRIGLVVALDLLGVTAPEEMWREEDGVG
ncbi:MAG TPA: arginine--tRNA ligase [Acidimicrobiaceae bacterium]|nr:arginine--tRNA ligase [Acidimicrobiaceae bacterium]HCV36668.1 arginine--tRNA ligase [Acidimicrobiaceae bacterium]HJO79374.1 arginine--tRNA ligase [Acidimicrobiales bacterium]|tara:strand:+ start:273 stop:1904 length:1632 start_codon:yes stop_codon:yes gene_type:complete